MSHADSSENAVAAVLVPIDFEPPARAALVFAARLATSAGMPLKILHAVHEPADRPNYYHRSGTGEASWPMELLAERRLEAFLAEVYAENPALSILEKADVLLVKGLPLTRILECVEHHAVAQIVMGHARARGVLPSLFSSLSDRVADKCDVPVTAIHAGGRSEAAVIPPRELLDGNSNVALGT
jgi:nucleotide-binding universal stress UspA family protein